MIKKIYICDRCEKEEDTYFEGYSLPRIQKFGLDEFCYNVEMHLCYDCAKEIGRKIEEVMKK